MYRLKQIRQALGMTQEAVAAHLKISRAAYTNIENGKRDPDTGTLIALAGLYGCTIDYLVGISDLPTNGHVFHVQGHVGGGALDEMEEKLVMDYRKLNTAGKDYVQQQMSIALHIYSQSDRAGRVEENA